MIKFIIFKQHIKELQYHGCLALKFIILLFIFKLVNALHKSNVICVYFILKHLRVLKAGSPAPIKKIRKEKKCSYLSLTLSLLKFRINNTWGIINQSKCEFNKTRRYLKMVV